MSERKPTFFWADLHLGHFNSIKFDNRPFRDLDHMHATLIANYNSTVPADGICYFLGDVNTHNAELTKSIIGAMHGTKVLILGNHDKGVQSCYNVGFDVVLNQAMIIIANEHVTMTHCPLRGVFREDTSQMHGNAPGELWHGEKRHPDFSIEDRGQFHLHGHIHSPNGGKSTKTAGRQYDVGCPANKYRPVHIAEIERWINRVKQQELKDKV